MKPLRSSNFGTARFATKNSIFAFRLLFLSRFLEVVKRDVVFADHLRQFPVRLELIDSFALPGFGIRFGIVDRNVDD